MIEIQAKIHDQYTLEFKVSYIAKRQFPISDFNMNTWIFVPYSLDINPKTYNKTNFYRDVRSYVRLITPVYSLKELAQEECLPYQLLLQSCKIVAHQTDSKAINEYEHLIKMFASITKSSIRDGCLHICSLPKEEERTIYCQNFISHIEKIILHYRELRKIIPSSKVPDDVTTYFNFGDEFMSNVIEHHTFRLQKFMQANYPAEYERIHITFARLTNKEMQYKKERGYSQVHKNKETENRNFVFRSGLLKKYIESDLYLIARKKRNTFVIEQLIYSLAAGIAMIFATIISFSFQQKYGNFTRPLFIALIISYMLKDRIKDLIRYYFAHKLGSKFFDYKIRLGMKNDKIGWMKEGFDYISEDKVPQRVRKERNRSLLLEAGNKRLNEFIIFYRKRVRLERKHVNRVSPFPLLGVNDIVRYNLSDFLRKMDNPNVPVFANEGNGEYELINAEKVYYLNFVIQCSYQGLNEYKRYRICINRKGIRGIETF